MRFVTCIKISICYNKTIPLNPNSMNEIGERGEDGTGGVNCATSLICFSEDCQF